MQRIQLDEKGLVPAIVQHQDTGEVLTLAYMSPDSIRRTLETGDVWFYSRSRADLWRKGETSGNVMRVRSVAMDCDGDTVLVKVDPAGPACHTGADTCFFTSVESIPEFAGAQKGPGILDEIYAVVQDRKRDMPEDSYTAGLLRRGPEHISRKVIEEASEVAIAGTKQDSEGLVQEVADLLYHAFVLLSASGVSPEDVWTELRKRRR